MVYYIPNMWDCTHTNVVEKKIFDIFKPNNSLYLHLEIIIQ